MCGHIISLTLKGVSRRVLKNWSIRHGMTLQSRSEIDDENNIGRVHFNSAIVRPLGESVLALASMSIYASGKVDPEVDYCPLLVTSRGDTQQT